MEEEEAADSIALEVECQVEWEVVVVDEELHRASLVGSLSNDKMPMRRSCEMITKLMSTKR